MPVIITITNKPTTIDGSGKVYNYSEYDRILKNVCKTEYEVFYSGQNQGRMDDELINAIQNDELFKVYYRPKTSIPYTYLGFTYNSNIIQYRTLPKNVDTNTEQRLQIHLLINNIENISVPDNNNFRGSGRYKKDVFIHAGLDINHKPNTNIGFYYYSVS